MASVPHSVSLQFLNPKTAGKTPWMGINPEDNMHILKKVRYLVVTQM
jgi:hypothetical protein